jgi:3-dehydroquinate synthase
MFVAGNWLHGEAVSAGTVMAADLSLRMGWIDQELFDRIFRILKAANLPVAPPEVIHTTLARKLRQQQGTTYC